jgi:hypothetical protein
VRAIIIVEVLHGMSVIDVEVQGSMPEYWFAW